MDKLRNLWGDALQYLAAASPRERRLIAMAASGAAVFIVAVSWLSFSRSINRAESSLEDKRADFAKVERLAANFGAQEIERKSLEQRLAQSPPALMSFVDGLAKQEQVDIGSMSDRGLQSPPGSKLRESQVEANLGKVPLDKLLRLLQAIERNPGVVRVRRLRLRKSFDNKEALDVSLTVSAWQAS